MPHLAFRQSVLAVIIFTCFLCMATQAPADTPDLPAGGRDCAQVAALPPAERDMLLRTPSWEQGWEYGFSPLCVNLP